MNMDLGEKLATITDKIYYAAAVEFNESGVSPTLAALIMENVSGRFHAAAYSKINAVRAAEEAERERKEAAEIVKDLQNMEPVKTETTEEKEG